MERRIDFSINGGNINFYFSNDSTEDDNNEQTRNIESNNHQWSSFYNPYYHSYYSPYYNRNIPYGNSNIDNYTLFGTYNPASHFDLNRNINLDNRNTRRTTFDSTNERTSTNQSNNLNQSSTQNRGNTTYDNYVTPPRRGRRQTSSGRGNGMTFGTYRGGDEGVFVTGNSRTNATTGAIPGATTDAATGVAAHLANLDARIAAAMNSTTGTTTGIGEINGTRTTGTRNTNTTDTNIQRNIRDASPNLLNNIFSDLDLLRSRDASGNISNNLNQNIEIQGDNNGFMSSLINSLGRLGIGPSEVQLQILSTNIPSTNLSNTSVQDLIRGTSTFVATNEFIDDSNTNTICSICHSQYEEGDILRSINSCNHVFHLSCIEEWLHNHTTCPVCRRDITTEDTNTEENSEQQTQQSQQTQQTTTIDIPITELNGAVPQ